MTPEPGIYEGVPDPDYRAWDAVSKSDLDAYVNPRKPVGRNLLIGSVLHCMLLEGRIATSERYFTSPEYNLRKKSEKEAMAKAEEAAGKIAVRPSEKTKLAALYEAINLNEDATAMIQAEGNNEVSVIGRLDGYETMSRARIDMVRRNCIADLKTTGCLDKYDFLNSCAKFGYHTQAAYYGDLYAEISGGGYVPFVHVCVSTRRHPDTDQHEVWVQQMAPEAVAYGRKHYQNIMTLYEREHSGNER